MSIERLNVGADTGHLRFDSRIKVVHYMENLHGNMFASGKAVELLIVELSQLSDHEVAIIRCSQAAGHNLWE